ncbi:MAG: hypothetical protein PHG64_09120 [Paludibacter sp.]|nr:hypothetical protein [Paludibacter sp.]
MTQSNYSNILGAEADLIIPGYEKSYPPGTFRNLVFLDRDSKDLFFQFQNKIQKAIGKQFLPVYRMSDGEFRFCIGRLFRVQRKGEGYVPYKSKKIFFSIQQLLNKKNRFKVGGTGYKSGTYESKEMTELNSQYINQLKEIAGKGFIAVHLSSRSNPFVQQYFKPIVKWFGDNTIPFNQENYIPFYFVYALLSGPLRFEIYQKRSILIVTHASIERQKAIKNSLEKEGVAKVQFLQLSEDRSMYDTIHLDSLKYPVDLALVGGGIGASNILCQLEPLSVPAIDAGFIIECLANPDRVKERTFCWPDSERDGDFRSI